MLLATASLAAFAFARLRFRGRDALFLLYLATMMIPFPVTMIPNFVIMRYLNWIDTFRALILPPAFSAFSTFLLRQYFMSIPLEMDDAARVDGASSFRIWWQIILPLTKPALATIAVFTFQGVWNDFYGPLIFLTNPDTYTLALGISFFRGLYNTEIPLMMAMSFLMVVPTLIAFFFAQRLMIRGVVLSGIKA